MSTRLHCTHCHQPIQNGHAVIRSSSFIQVATHKLGECPKVPTQRSALGERLAKARA